MRCGVVLSSARFHFFPPSVDTSTVRMAPPPDQASPLKRVRDDRLGSDLFAERSLFRILTEMPEVVVVHVIPVDDLDAPQILGVEDSLEAGGDYAHWKPLLRPQGLAVHAVGNQAVVHRFGDGHARGALHFLGAFSDEPCRAALQAALLEQR